MSLFGLTDWRKPKGTMHPELEARNRFSQPPWERLMAEEADAVSIGQIAPMFRYLFAKVEMLEEKVERLEAEIAEAKGGQE